MSRRGTRLALVTGALALLSVLGLAPGEARAERLGLQAPDGEGRIYDVARLRGQVVVITFGSHSTRGELQRVNDALKARARTGEVALVSVIDIGAVPSLFHGLARRRISAAGLAQREVKFLVDEESSMRRRLSVRPDERVDVLVLDKDGTLRGRFCGSGELPRVEALLGQLRAPLRTPAQLATN